MPSVIKKRVMYEGNRRVLKTIDPKRSKVAKKAARSRKGKPLSAAHRKAISIALKKSKRFKAALRHRKHNK